jgi:hypothetical protein
MGPSPQQGVSRIIEIPVPFSVLFMKSTSGKYLIFAERTQTAGMWICGCTFEKVPKRDREGRFCTNVKSTERTQTA